MHATIKFLCSEANANIHTYAHRNSMATNQDNYIQNDLRSTEGVGEAIGTTKHYQVDTHSYYSNNMVYVYNSSAQKCEHILR